MRRCAQEVNPMQEPPRDVGGQSPCAGALSHATPNTGALLSARLPHSCITGDGESPRPRCAAPPNKEFVRVGSPAQRLGYPRSALPRLRRTFCAAVRLVASSGWLADPIPTAVYCDRPPRKHAAGSGATMHISDTCISLICISQLVVCQLRNSTITLLGRACRVSGSGRCRGRCR